LPCVGDPAGIRRDFPQQETHGPLPRPLLDIAPAPGGLTSLPKDPEAAAQASRTIRYQRERIRRWVREEGGTIIYEEVFLELAPDRGSEHILPTVDRFLKRCRTEKAQLVLVEFWSAFGWRRHGPLAERFEANADLCVLLDPVPLTSAEAFFDPVEHFRTWRKVEGAHAASKADRKADLAEAIAERQDGHFSLAELAKVLNADRLLTPTGKPWSRDNLGKFLRAL
jgi:hypothetical protein